MLDVISNDENRTAWAPMTQEETEAIDNEFLPCAIQGRIETIEECMDKGLSVAPITKHPEWTPLDWTQELAGGWNNISREKPTEKRLRLTMDLGEAEARITLSPRSDRLEHNGIAEYFKYFSVSNLVYWYQGKGYKASIEDKYCEMQAPVLAVNDPSKAIPQDVLDRTAPRLSVSTDDWPVSFYAAIVPRGRCTFCARKLDDPVSRILQVGPTCAKQNGLLHNESIAKRVFDIRAKQKAE